MAEQQSILGRVLDPSAYGFEKNGRLYVPSRAEIFREFFCKLNFLDSRKNWLPLFRWFSTLSFAIPLILFFVLFFSLPVAFVGFIYGAVILGSHGTFWLHRYSTHRAFNFRNVLVREICRNLVIKIIPDETYVISHQGLSKRVSPRLQLSLFNFSSLRTSNHNGRLMKSMQRLNAYLTLMLILSACANLQHSDTSKTSFGGTQKGGPSRKVSEAELQDDLLRFESQFNAAIQDADRDLEASSESSIRYRAALNRLIYNTNSLGIATGPSPEANLLDMVTFIELSRDVLEHYWIPKVFGRSGTELDQAFRQSSERVWGIADKVLGPQQKQVLANYIRNWRKKHPDQVNVETVRLSAFSYEKDLAPNEQKEIGGLFASVQQATEAADSARLFAERALYYAERAPTLLRLQTKLGTHEVMSEIGLSLTELPLPNVKKSEITDLLKELQNTLRIAKSTLGDANDTVKSVSHLFEQQAARPDVAQISTDTLTQLTTLLREWNQTVTSSRYQNGISQMAGVASSFEQNSNRLVTRMAKLGAGLIVLFWIMALLAMLAYRFVSNSLRRREIEAQDGRKDRAA